MTIPSQRRPYHEMRRWCIVTRLPDMTTKVPKTTRHTRTSVTISSHLFLVCLYMKRFRVLRMQSKVRFSVGTRVELFQNLRRELSKLMSNHILSDADIVIYLAIVYLEDEINEIWQYCGAPRLGFDRWHPYTGLGPSYRQTSTSLALHSS